MEDREILRGYYMGIDDVVMKGIIEDLLSGRVSDNTLMKEISRRIQESSTNKQYNS